MLRSDVELALTKRCGALVARAGLDGTTASGANADCNDPIADALDELNLFATNRSLVTDNDVANVPQSQQRQFLALAELRYLQNGLFNLTLYNERWVNHSEDLDQLGKRLQAAIDLRIAEIKRRWGDTGTGFFVGPLGGLPDPSLPQAGLPQPLNPRDEVNIYRFIP